MSDKSWEEILEEVNDDRKIAEMFWTNPRTVNVVLCPKCGKTNTPLVAHFDVHCKFCQEGFKCSPNPDLAQTYYKGLVKKLKYKNSVFIYMDLKWGEDILENLKEDFRTLQNTGMLIKAEGPFKEYKIDRSQCNQCGVCMQCIRCLSCNEIFSNENLCPKCGSKKLTKFYFKKVKYSKKSKKYVCPNCDNSNIRFTVFDGNLNKCKSCKTEDITIGNRKPYYILILRRYGGAVLK